jgi:eukaryotic-like serine/threonine-protein kinase
VESTTSSSPSIAKSVKPRAPFSPDDVIAERYRILKLLGGGSTGMVYEAEHVLLHKKVALKILHAELGEMPDGVARFEREAKATARIDHDNVAAAIDFGRLPEGLMFLALEFVEGKSLRAEIAKGPLGVPRALHIARQIAAALAAAQKLEIVHRDLKPENVMLVLKGDDADFVKVLDFGVARVPVEESATGGPEVLTKAGAVFGTEEYMPPEQGIGQKVDTRADLYALGVMLFEMIAGVRPYARRDDVGILAQQLTLPIPTFAERVQGLVVPRSLERLVMRLLAKRPQERIARAADVLKAIDDYLAEPAGGPDAAEVTTGSEEPLPAFALNTELEILVSAADRAKAAADAARAESATAEPASSETPAKVEPGKSFTDVVSQASRGLGQSVRTASVAMGTRGRAWSVRLRKELARAPKGVVVSLVAGALLWALIGIGVWQWRARVARAAQAAAASASAAVAAQAAAASASAAAQAAASAASDMVRIVPTDADSKDPDALLNFAEAKLSEKKELEAVNTISRVLGRHPDRRSDPRVANILFKTAASTAKGVSYTTFSLLEGTMSAPGSEIIYRLAVDKSLPSSVRTRAEQWLHNPKFERAASDSLKVAVHLRFTSTCEGKHAILPMAAKVGDKATLAYLHELESQTGCGLTGKSDCFACLRHDDRLKDAIAQIEARSK